jgi:hypothetical protein
MKPFLISVVIAAMISCGDNKQENSEQSKTKNVSAAKYLNSPILFEVFSKFLA